MFMYRKIRLNEIFHKQKIHDKNAENSILEPLDFDIFCGMPLEPLLFFLIHNKSLATAPMMQLQYLETPAISQTPIA